MEKRHSDSSEYRLALMLGQGFLQCLGKLVGAGGAFAATADAVDPGDDILHRHAFHQGADALQVAVTSTQEANIFQFAVFNLKCESMVI